MSMSDPHLGHRGIDDVREQPDLADVIARVGRIRRSRRRLGTGMVAFAALAIAVPVGMAARQPTVTEVIAEPAATASSAATAAPASGAAASSSAEPSLCPPSPADQAPLPRVTKPIAGSGAAHAAAEDIDNLAKTDYPDYYAGLAVCNADERVDVYRLPNERFDKELATLAEQHGVQVIVHRGKFPRADALTLSYRIYDMAASLERDQGVRIVGTSVQVNGIVEVEVNSDPDAARRALSKYADKIHIVHVTHGPAETM